MKRQKGFTLIELLITIGIVAVLASIIIASLNQGRASAQEKAIVSNLKSFGSEANILYSETGSYAGIANCKDSGSSFNKFVQGIETANGAVISCSGNADDWSLVVNYPASDATKSFSIGPSGAVSKGAPATPEPEGSPALVWDPYISSQNNFFIHAVPVCTAKGMRLPTIYEVRDAYNAGGVFDSVPRWTGAYLMSATEHTSTSIIVMDVNNGLFYSSGKSGPVASYYFCVK